jgi:hypothetical protein
MKIDPKKHRCAIRCNPECGPIFSYDIFIVNNANTTADSFSNLGFSYKHPQYEHSTNKAKTFLAGSQNFQLYEIEVYQKK